MHTIVAGLLASSRYIVYSDVPDGVFRTHGSSLVPLPVATGSARFGTRFLDRVAGRVAPYGNLSVFQARPRSAREAGGFDGRFTLAPARATSHPIVKTT